MTLENQVCSLELAKEMKELGFKQDSEFYYADNEDGELLLVFDNGSDDKHPIMSNLGEFEEEDSINVSAYTVAELGEMLPGELYFEKDCSYAFLEMIKTDDNSYGYYYEHITGRETPYPKLCDNEYLSETEADARAKMLIYLKNNNLI